MKNKIKKIIKKNKICLKLLELRYEIKLLLRAYTWIIFNFLGLKKEISKKKIIKVKPYRINEWRHKGINYFTGFFEEKKVFIKCMENKLIVRNEWNAFKELKKSKSFKKSLFINYRFFKDIKGKGLIVSDYIEGNSLNEIELSKKEKQKVIKQLKEALLIMKESKIIHRDINPTNIFFKDGDFNQLKIIDFAYAVSNSKETLLEEQIENLEILKSLNFFYKESEYVWEDAYSIKKIIEKDLNIVLKENEIKMGELIYEKN